MTYDVGQRYVELCVPMQANSISSILIQPLTYVRSIGWLDITTPPLCLNVGVL